LDVFFAPKIKFRKGKHQKNREKFSANNTTQKEQKG
jgi:hypothetical protein